MITSSRRPRDLSVFLTSTNQTRDDSIIEFNSNSEFYGTVYAPNARIPISSNFTIFGAIKALAVRLAANSRLHFDEDLLYDPEALEIYARLFQKRLSPQEVREIAVGAMDL